MNSAETNLRPAPVESEQEPRDQAKEQDSSDDLVIEAFRRTRRSVDSESDED